MRRGVRPHPLVSLFQVILGAAFIVMVLVVPLPIPFKLLFLVVVGIGSWLHFRNLSNDEYPPFEVVDLPDDASDAMEELEELLSKRLITDDEYQAKRRELLARL